jgi:hypothetical protein
VSLTSGTLTDTFGAYAVHVYEVPAVAAQPPDVGTTDPGTGTTSASASSSVVTAASVPAVVAPAFATARIGVSTLDKADQSSFDQRLGI